MVLREDALPAALLSFVCVFFFCFYEAVSMSFLQMQRKKIEDSNFFSMLDSLFYLKGSSKFLNFVS